MSRRDTIIIGVLINAGLLAILFVMAVNNDEEKIDEHPDIELAMITTQKPSQHIEKQKNTTHIETQPTDELDRILNDLAISEPPPSIVIEDYSHQESMAVISPPPHKTSDVTYVDVTVKKGDSLEKIAKANGTTVSAIVKANSLKTERLQIGQVLRVPIKKSETDKPASSTVAPKPAASTEAEYYTIKSGDNPWKLARQYHVKFDDLLKMNDLDEEKAKNLKVGDRIRIR